MTEADARVLLHDCSGLLQGNQRQLERQPIATTTLPRCDAP
jgi:hypothetical protein